MTSKQSSHVVRRQCRGRSRIESQNKTDSGCFVDEELERNPGPVGTKSAASTASPNDKHTSPGQQSKQNSRTNIEDTSSPQRSANTQNVTSDDEEMSQAATNGSATDATNASSPRVNVKTSPDRTRESEQQSEEFYCLYYSSSPNSTLEKPCNSQGKKPPPVLPKPKSKRASVPVFPTNDPIFAKIEKLETELNKNGVSSDEQDDVTVRRRRRHTMDGSLPYGDGITLEALGDGLAWEQTFEERVKRFEALGETRGVEKTTETSKHDRNSFTGSSSFEKQTKTYEKNICFQNKDKEVSHDSVTITTESLTIAERREMAQHARPTTQQHKQKSGEEFAVTLNEQTSYSSDNLSLDDEIENFLDELDKLSPLPGEDDASEEGTSDIKAPLLAGAKGTSDIKAPLLARAKGTSDIKAPLFAGAKGGEAPLPYGPTNHQVSFSLEATGSQVPFPKEVRGQEVPLAIAEDIMEPQYEFDEFMVYNDEEDEQDEYDVQVPEVFSSEDDDDDELERSAPSGREIAISAEQSHNVVVGRDALSDAASDGFATDASGYMSECSTVTLDDSVDLSTLPVFSRSTADDSVDLSTLPVFSRSTATTRDRNTMAAKRVDRENVQKAEAAGEHDNEPSTERWVTEQNLHSRTGGEVEADTRRRPLSNLRRRPGSFCGVVNDSSMYLKNRSNALKRRSWSVCDPPTEYDEDQSPFIRKVYQTSDLRSAAKSTTFSPTAASKADRTAAVYNHNEVFSDAQKISQTPETYLRRTNLFSSTLSPVGIQKRSRDVDRPNSPPVSQKQALQELRVEVTRSPALEPRAAQRRVLNTSSVSDHSGDSDSILWFASPQKTSSAELVRPVIAPISGLDEDQRQKRQSSTRKQRRRFSPAGSVENLRTQTLRKLSKSNTTSESGAVRFSDGGFVPRVSQSPERYSTVSATPFRCGPKKHQSLSERFTNILEYAHNQQDEDVKEMIEEALRIEPEQFLEDEELERVLLTAEALNVKQLLGSGFPPAPPDMEPNVSGAPHRPPKTTACQTDDEEEFGLRRQTSDRETQTSQLQLAQKALSAEDLLKLLSSVADLNLGSGRLDTSPSPGAEASGSPQRSSVSERLGPGPSALHASDTGLNDPSRRPHRPLSIQRYPGHSCPPRAASTGNIHRGRGYHNVYGLYEHNRTTGFHSAYRNANAKQTAVASDSSREQSRSVDSIMRDLHALRSKGRDRGVIKARMVGSRRTLNDQSHSGSRIKPQYFEEEIDCMKTKEAEDVSSVCDSGSSGSNGSLDGATSRSGRILSVSFEGSELSDNESEDVHFIRARKCPLEMRMRKEPDEGGSSMRDKGFQLEVFDEQSLKDSQPSGSAVYESEETHFEPPPRYEEAISDRQLHDQETRDGQSRDHVSRDGEQHDKHCIDIHDQPPREIDNGVSVFIDYKKKIMRVSENTNKASSRDDSRQLEGTSLDPVPSTHASTSTPKEGEPRDPVLTGGQRQKAGSPLRDLYSIREERSVSESDSFGTRSSSSFSSDDDRFGEFGGSVETVVLVGDDSEGESGGESGAVSPATRSPDRTRGKKEGPSSEKKKMQENRASLEIERILLNARGHLDEEVVNNDLLDAAMDRVRERLSPRAGEASCGLAMETFVALHQADELQAIINEIKGEMMLLQEENDMLREKVVNLSFVHTKPSEVKTSGETTQNSSTEASERMAAGQSKQTTPRAHSLTEPCQGQANNSSEVFELDVCLEGFENSSPIVGSKEHKRAERRVKLGSVRIVGETDWHGVYEASVETFMEHVRSVDPELSLGLGSKSIKKLQTGVEMWTPGTLPRKGPHVELTKQSNPCVIKLKDGSDGCCDELVYDSLLPRELVENFVYQVLQHRHVVLCGPQGLGKSHLAARLAEHVVQRIGYVRYPAVLTYDVTQTSRKELRHTLNNFMRCNISSQPDGVPAVIILDQLNCLSSLSDVFDVSQLERKRHSPFLIGVRNKSKKGPFSSKDLMLYQYFRWIQISVHDKPIESLLGRFLKRKLSWTTTISRTDARELLLLFDWLSEVWRHINQILEDYCDSEAALGPGLFYACPMEYKAAEKWFVSVWNHTIVPFIHQKLRAGKKIYDRDASWEDPTKWVITRYPWDRETSKVLHKLKKIRQVDIVLNRNLDASYTEATLDEDTPTLPLTKVHPKKIKQMKVMSTGSKEKMIYIDDSASEFSDSDRVSETSI